MKDFNNTINVKIKQYREELLKHSLYSNVKTDRDLKTFMHSHIFAVWDFMSLLKHLQNSLTCVSNPWIPVGNPELRFLINEIVLAEETDLDQNGNRCSHFEMYLNAMQSMGLDTRPVQEFILKLSRSENIIKEIESSNLKPHIKQFLNFTFSTIHRGKNHEIAAAFTYGREDLIPEMFTEIIQNLSESDIEVDLKPITYYFNRHIELDQDEHGPMAHKMVAILCGEDEKKWNEAAQIAQKSLESRIKLFNGILKEIKKSGPVPV